MYLVINKWVTAVKVSNFPAHYLRNRSTLDIGVLGYIGIVWPKEHSPEVWHIPPGTPCILLLKSVIMLFHTTPTYSIYQLHIFVEVMRKKFSTVVSYFTEHPGILFSKYVTTDEVQNNNAFKRSQDKAQNQWEY